jgi:ABC-type transport system involved in multi-copper enzyme maturation permease subunit
MNKTLALLLDSYRELNAKRLFWIVLAVSALVVGAFSMIGLKNNTITVLWWDTPLKWDVFSMIKPAMLYKLLFSYFGVGFWLTWIANILALISTAGIFPDFMAGGSIDLYLSKPISRLRLFLTKYLGGLLFVTLQVSVFSLCCFLLVGLRGHEWEPAIFLSIPLVVLVFSYLFSVCVLLGIMTRSTVAALLLTLLVWFTIWGVQFTEQWLLINTVQQRVQSAALDKQIEETKTDLARFPTTGSTTQKIVAIKPPPRKGMFGFFGHDETRSEIQNRLDNLLTKRAEITTTINTVHSIAFMALTPLPKTDGTTQLLDRELIKRADLPHPQEDQDSDSDAQQSFSADGSDRNDRLTNRREFRKELEKEQDKRSAVWILGTSLGFELVILSLAGWIFCARDY